MAMRVAMLSAECEPWAKTGGLADVVDALARASGRLHGEIVAPVDVYLPRYRTVEVPADARPPAVIHVPDPLSPSGTSEVSIIDVAADGYRLRLVDHPAAFDRDAFYGDADGDYADNAWRFGLFGRAALETMRVDGDPIDLLHLHDWHGGPAALFRDERYADDPVIGDAAIVHTLHNLAYRGWTPRDRLRELGLVPGDGVVATDVEGLDLLATGIERAELVTTVSPTFAVQALTPEYGRGLEGLLRAKGDRFIGILNGLDTTVWDPDTDQDLPARYRRGDLAGKAVCRSGLLREVGFDEADDGIVLAMIGRLDAQKGFDILAAASPVLLERGVRLVVLGAGRPELADPFRELVAAAPDRVALIERFDRALARRIYAGADAFLMPSTFEPCGQGQMIALRYGTPPIVRRTGGLADSVVDVTDDPGHGTGFLFDAPAPDALLEACERAIALRADDGPGWAALVDRGMSIDFDWTSGSAPRYVDAYGWAIDIRRERAGGP